MHTQTQAGETAARELWPLPDFCQSFGVSRSTAYDLLSSGVLSGRKVGRRTLITAASVNAWAASLPAFESGAVLVGIPTQTAAA